MTALRATLRGIPRLARTARHLTARQILWRVITPPRLALYRAAPAVAAAQARGAGRIAPRARETLETWIARRHPDGPSASQAALAERVRSGDFAFVGESAQLGLPPAEWSPAGRSRLYLYHLHYFDYLRALCLNSRAAGDDTVAQAGWEIARDWLARNPAGSRPGWEPYPTAVRLINWVAAWTIAPPPDDGSGWFAGALATQARFLARHLEFHVGGNHLIKDAAALLVASAALGGREAEGWRARGLELLRSELRRQILADGGHAERSARYHAVVLEDVLDCAALTGADDLRATARRMGEWLAVMRDEDGGLPLFNDSVAYPETLPGDLLRYCADIGGTLAPRDGNVVSLEASGYTILRSADSRMVIDCGEIGPDELPAHAHADTLSYELALRGARTVVDSGTSGYEAGPARDRERSTAAHNTVVVDEEDQSEVWGSHRVGRRAHPLGVRAWSDAGGLGFAGAHDGYARIGVLHQRHVLAIPPAWIVVDELLGRGRHRYASRVHMHPSWSVTAVGREVRLVGPAGQSMRLQPIGEVELGVENGTYAEAFGEARPNAVVRLAGSGALPVLVGYVLAPDEARVAVSAERDGDGIVVSGEIDGRPITVRSGRTCVSSS